MGLVTSTIIKSMIAASTTNAPSPNSSNSVVDVFSGVGISRIGGVQVSDSAGFSSVVPQPFVSVQALACSPSCAQLVQSEHTQFSVQTTISGSVGITGAIGHVLVVAGIKYTVLQACPSEHVLVCMLFVHSLHSKQCQSGKQAVGVTFVG